MWSFSLSFIAISPTSNDFHYGIWICAIACDWLVDKDKSLLVGLHQPMSRPTVFRFIARKIAVRTVKVMESLTQERKIFIRFNF